MTDSPSSNLSGRVAYRTLMCLDVAGRAVNLAGVVNEKIAADTFRARAAAHPESSLAYDMYMGASRGAAVAQVPLGCFLGIGRVRPLPGTQDAGSPWQNVWRDALIALDASKEAYPAQRAYAGARWYMDWDHFHDTGILGLISGSLVGIGAAPSALGGVVVGGAVGCCTGALARAAGDPHSLAEDREEAEVFIGSTAGTYAGISTGCAPGLAHITAVQAVRLALVALPTCITAGLGAVEGFCRHAMRHARGEALPPPPAPDIEANAPLLDDAQ